VARNKVLELILIWRFSEKNPKLFQRKVQESLTTLSRHEMGERVQVHWNLAAVPFLSDESETGKSIFRRVADRCNLHGDSIIPMGYAGACHSLLTDEELKKELGWATTNPWGTGFQDRMGLTVDHMMPHQMDFLKTSVRKSYSDSHYTWLIAPPLFIPRSSEDLKPGSLEFFDHGSFRAFTLIVPAGAGSPHLYRLLKKSVSRLNGPVIFLLDFTYADEPAYVTELLDTLVRLEPKTEIRFRRLRESISGACRYQPDREDTGKPGHLRIPGTEAPLMPAPHEPVDRILAADAGRVRYGILKKAPYFDVRDEIRRILEESAGSSRPGKSAQISTETSAATPVERRLIADMPGTVLLKEHDFEVLFNGGRFTDILLHGVSALAGLPSETYMSVSDSVYRSEPQGTYSFEREEVRGLREILTLDAGQSVEPGKIITDYLLVADGPSLVVSCDISYPVFPKEILIREYAPLEIPIFLVDSDDVVGVRGFYPDNRWYSADLPAQPRVYELPGTLFQFRKDDILFTLEFPFVESSPIEILPVKFRSHKKELLLTANPRGSYYRGSSDGISGFREHFTMLLRAETDGFEEHESYPGDAGERLIEELQPGWIARSS